ncbi:MAG TPA: hypothetical protein VHL57_00980 [Flavobacteriales bacterium]|nr:hypothetical protein [Flavobacteriales bacterium]
MRVAIALLVLIVVPAHAHGQREWEWLMNSRANIAARAEHDSLRVGPITTGLLHTAYDRSHAPEHVFVHFSIDATEEVDSTVARDWPEWLVSDSIVLTYRAPAELDRQASRTENACDRMVVSIRPGTWLVLHGRWAPRYKWRTPTAHWKGRIVLTITVQRDANGDGRMIYHYTSLERSVWKRMRREARKRKG